MGGEDLYLRQAGHEEGLYAGRTCVGPQAADAAEEGGPQLPVGAVQKCDHHRQEEVVALPARCMTVQLSNPRPYSKP